MMHAGYFSEFYNVFFLFCLFFAGGAVRHGVRECVGETQKVSRIRH